MTARLRQLAAALAAAALVGAGCGSDEQQGEGLPREAVAALDDRLDEVESRYRDGTEDDNKGACDDIGEDSIPAMRKQVSDLPDDVDPDIVEALEASVDRLAELTRADCADVEPPQTDTVTEPETVPDVTIPEETTPQETATEEEKPKEEKKEEKKQEKEDGQDGGAVPPVPEEGGGAPAPESGAG